MSISLCMIVKNEETMLGRCLESVKHITDEMIIVDTGSTDSTVEIAERYGADVYYFPWNGSFSAARNYALEHAKMDWVWIMDADDEFERKDTDKLVDMVSNKYTATAYYCKTLSYLGDKPDPSNLLCNLNIYLFKNHMGYRFTGDIHEQLYCSGPKAVSTTAISDMRVYHYGYLNDPERTQAKRERNVTMILKELQKRPDDPFMLYNLGNEYYAQLRTKEAFDCYLKSFESFSRDSGYSSKLVLRLVACCEILGKTSEQLEYIETGLKYYPEYTDLEFIRGTVWLQKERYLAAIKSFKKCLEMGDPPLHISYIAGVGSYKAAHMLCQIYNNLGDPENMMRFGRIALKLNPGNRDVLILLASSMMDKMTPDIAAKKLAGMIPALPNKNLLLSDAFYALRRWDIALSFARKAIKKGEDPDTAHYDQGVCLLFLKRYSEACTQFSLLAGSDFEDRASFLSHLCAFFDMEITVTLPRGNSAYFTVLERFEGLMGDKNCPPLATDEATSKPYTDPIFELLNILMRTEHFDEFDKARRLLNLITDDSVLKRLGKIYFFNGYLKPAYRELERSIKLTGKTDAEALRMMKYILDAKVLDI